MSRAADRGRARAHGGLSRGPRGGAPKGVHTPGGAAVSQGDDSQQGESTTPREVVYIQKTVVRKVGEPYPGWREHLIAAFRALKPETDVSTGRRYKIGRVARMVMRETNEESYLVGARYDINHNPGARVDGYTRVLEAIIRSAEVKFSYDRLGGLMPYSSQMIKADCGIRIIISIKPISQALGL